MKVFHALISLNAESNHQPNTHTSQQQLATDVTWFFESKRTLAHRGLLEFQNTCSLSI